MRSPLPRFFLILLLTWSAAIPPRVLAQSAGEYRQQGLALREQERLPAAIAALQKAVELDPTNLSGRVLLGWTQHLAGQRSAAITTLLDTLRINDRYVPALNALGIVYLVEGNLTWAVITHNLARLLKPNNEIAYYNLSLAYHRLQLYDWAIRDARQAALIEPYNPHPLIAEAIAQWDQGNLSRSRQIYERATALKSQYGDRAYLDELARAGFSPGQIQVAAAILKTP
ncbi:MAG: tetratricopeptide repeat protein [Leptolyngbyaceae cyanobacterium bins.59]|nr:tetratricopeptide repeat protein [Leptolyngbyaceae cyanobacterium bins.59]